MCSIFYPGEIFLENTSSANTAKRMCPTEPCTTGETPRACTRAKVVISCSTFSNADHGYSIDFTEVLIFHRNVANFQLNI